MPADTAVRVICHVGFHKSGTTSLQNALAAHRRLIAPHFRVETRASNPAMTVATEAARAYSRAPEPAMLRGFETAMAGWLAGLTLEPGQGLLISSEDFAGHMPGDRGVQDYGAAAHLTKVMAAVIGARFPAVRLSFLFTTRNPGSWLKSVHWQLAKHPAMELSAERFARKFGAAAAFSDLLAGIRTAATGVDVIETPLESLIARRLGPVEAVYDLAELPDGLRHQLDPVPRANRSPPFDLSGAFVALNREGLPKPVLKRLKLALLAAAELDREIP